MDKAVSMEKLEQKINRAQQEVAKYRERYDTANTKLKDLLGKRDLARHEEIISAISKSDRTHEEILDFLRSKNNREMKNKSTIKFDKQGSKGF